MWIDSYENSILVWFHCKDTNGLYVSLSSPPAAMCHKVIWICP